MDLAPRDARSTSASEKTSNRRWAVALTVASAFHLAVLGLVHIGRPLPPGRTQIILGSFDVALGERDGRDGQPPVREKLQQPKPIPHSRVRDSSGPAANAHSPPMGGQPDGGEPGAGAAAANDAVIEGQSRPPYPRVSRALGEEGEAQFRVQITPIGEVSSVVLERSSGHERLDRAAAEFLGAARFKRGSDSAEPITKSISILFKLNER